MATILVVEDEPTILAVLVEVLRDEGHETLTAPDGAAALELLATASPALVITDVMIPGPDGRELVRRMRERPALRSVPVVLMSAVLHPDLDGLGPASFLPKPFDLDRLLQELERWLGA